MFSLLFEFERADVTLFESTAAFAAVTFDGYLPRICLTSLMNFLSLMCIVYHRVDVSSLNLLPIRTPH
jgi:hypothetical protein